MKIAACLAWYREPPDFLTRCITNLNGIVHLVVAIEGRWDGFPAQPDDEHLQLELAAVRTAAAAARLPLYIESGLTWSSQVAKRDHLMRQASKVADWLLVIDGDEWLQPADGDELRSILASTSLDVATVTLVDTPTGGSAPIRRIYCAPITVETAHNGYRTADGRWLHGAPHAVTLEPTVPTPLILHHHPRSRGDQRNRAASEYRAHRRRHQTELWRPGGVS